MAALTIQDVLETGLAAAYGAASGGGDTARNLGGDVMLHIKNSDSASHTVTVTFVGSNPVQVGSLGPVTKANAMVAVPAGGDRFLGPYPPGAYNDPNGNIAITYTSVVGMTIAAIRLPKAA